MARFLTNTVEYFPHFANASEKRTITVLETKYGIAGYCAWFKLLECLAKTDGHAIYCNNDVDYQYLSSRLHIDNDQLKNILNTLSDLSAIDQELWNNAHIIWSDNFVKQIADVYRNRKREPPIKPSNNHQSTSNLPVIYTQSGEKGKKVKEREDSKESKVEERIETIYNLYNSKNIVVHKKLTDKMVTKCNSALKDYELNEILKAIDNYGEVINHPELYYFSYKWTLEDFMARGLGKFMDNVEPLKNFLKDKAKQTTRQPLKSSEDIAKENEEFMNRGNENVSSN